MIKTNEYDLNLYLYATLEGDTLVAALYPLYINEHGSLTTHTDEVYDSITIPASEEQAVREWALAELGIDMSQEEDAWASIKSTTNLPGDDAPKLRAMLRDLPAYDLYDRRDEN